MNHHSLRYQHTALPLSYTRIWIGFYLRLFLSTTAAIYNNAYPSSYLIKLVWGVQFQSHGWNYMVCSFRRTNVKFSPLLSWAPFNAWLPIRFILFGASSRDWTDDRWLETTYFTTKLYLHGGDRGIWTLENVGVKVRCVSHFAISLFGDWEGIRTLNQRSNSPSLYLMSFPIMERVNRIELS